MSILDISDDFDLCDQLWCALSEHRIDVDACDELERVVRLVWDSSGLIGNGGFYRFFEGDYPGDPDFLYTVAAYKRIGADGAYEALQAAFGQFPGGVLPTNIHERLRVLESLPEQTWEEIESRYYNADKETEHCLARFIREHRSGYERLLEAKRAESDCRIHSKPPPVRGAAPEGPCA